MNKKYILNYAAKIISLLLAAHYIYDQYVLMAGIFLILAYLIEIVTKQEKIEDKASRWIDD